AAEQDRLVQEIGIDEPELDRFRVNRPVDGGVEALALAHEVVLRNRELDDEPFKARIAARKRQLAGRFFLDIDAEHDAVRRRALGLLDLQLLLEEAEALDAVLAALDLERVERVALVETELAP